MQFASRCIPSLAWTFSLALFVAACGGGDGTGTGGSSGNRDGGADASDGDGGGDGGGDSGTGFNGNLNGNGSGDGGRPPGCGDGEADPEAGTEECDDGNAVGGDGCSELCEIESGWLCPPEGGACEPNCGDGALVGAEQCDDGNSTDGDGCTRDCMLEPGYACPAPGSACQASSCGDGVIAGAENCEDGNTLPGDGCGLDCQQEPGWLCVGTVCSAAECGDGIRAGMEQCDDGNTDSGDGCLADCSGVEPFYTCPVMGGACSKITRCGDGIVTPDEVCDDGNAVAGDGCTHCMIDEGFLCPGGRSCAPVCGDGVVAGREQCDDGGQCVGGGDDGDRCVSNGDCSAMDCQPVANDGCDATCRLEPGFKCDEPGMPCEVAVCGNGITEGLEECDDGTLVGTTAVPDNNLGDGCTPFCKREPDCSGGTCQARCGDGILADDEACDDGNQYDNDGCSSACELEEGYRCEVITQTPSAQVNIPVVYRDFRAFQFRVGRACVGGSDEGEFCEDDSDCESDDCSRACRGDRHCCDADEAGCLGGHPDFQRVNFAASGMVEDELDAQGKPVWTGLDPSPVFSSESFAEWYRDTENNATVVDYMTLDSCPGGSCDPGTGLCVGGSLDGVDCGTYVFDDQHFYPLTGRGFNDPAALPGAFDETYEDGDLPDDQNDHNFHFTSEVRYWFEYQGDEVLSFRGDDDVWVFINGILAVDIGGVHDARDGCISLRDDQSGCGSNLRTPGQLGLEEGGIYEVVVFQAERHTTRSSYKLTLAGFFTSKTQCAPFCGDGVVTPDEACDAGSLCSMGSQDGADCGVDEAAEIACVSGGGMCESQNELTTTPYDGCFECSVRGAYCGDGFVDDPQEACDDGAAANDGRYEGCNPDCTTGPFCGDGNTDGFFGEQCDDGADNADDTYGVCSTHCTLGPRCGDGVRQRAEGEQCDNGVNADAYDGCAPGCVRAPYCGDGTRQAAFGEQCDDGDDNDGAYGGCTSDCRLAPYCGDGTVDEDAGEECDDGNTNSFDGCSRDCEEESILI